MIVLTHYFGLVDLKPKRIFEHKGEVWAVVSYPYKTWSGGTTYYSDTVVHYKTGGKMQTFIPHKKTIKGLIEQVKLDLDRCFVDLGEQKFYQSINELEILNK